MGLDQDFMMGWFRRYYQDHPPAAPDMFRSREFGFMFFDRNFVQRHVGFPGPADLHYFLRSEVPAHAYYSTAYYETPAAPTMEEKSWKGADLIFDLDADHVKGAELLSYPEMLARIKDEVLRLVDDFLMGDLGFDDTHLKIVFSGGRGYHIHVADARLLTLKSHERREIVDYISGTDLNMEWVFPEKTVNVRTFQDRSQVSKVRLVPPETSGGWKKRMRQGMKWLINDMRSRDLADLRERLPSLAGESDATIEGMLKDLYTKKGEREGGDLMLDKNVLDAFTSSKHEALFLRLLEEEVRPRFTSEIDEPVTSDIKRLIRLPGSLHGKTGLRVTTMERDELDHFQPLRDAVPDTYTDDPVELFVKGRAEVELRGIRSTFEGWCEVPAYAAVFLVARKMATLDASEER